MRSGSASTLLKKVVPLDREVRLEGKVAIITGGASGSGAATARLFHQNGAKVLVADIQDNLGKALAQKLGDNACFIHCDVSNEEDIRNLVDTTVGRQGKLDIMHINNAAGTMARPFRGILDAKKEEVDQILGVNLVGAVLGAKHAARVMMPRHSGCILFTASVCTVIGGVPFDHAYAASEHGIVGAAKFLAAELGQYGIRVNCVLPPYEVFGPMAAPNEAVVPGIEAPMSEMGNLKRQVHIPEGVAYGALYLASDEANYVSGVNLVLDGGFSIVNPIHHDDASQPRTNLET